MKAENDVNGSMCFSSVTSLVSGWTLDFMFLSLCRYFKEGNLDKFNETLSTFEGMLLPALAYFPKVRWK